MAFSAKTALALALVATSVALLSVSSFNSVENSSSVGDNLDCGFTQDFQDFLNSNGNFFILFRLWHLQFQQT